MSKQKLEIGLASLPGDRSVVETCREHRVTESLLRGHCTPSRHGGSRNWSGAFGNKTRELEIGGKLLRGHLARSPDLAAEEHSPARVACLAESLFRKIKRSGVALDEYERSTSRDARSPATATTTTRGNR